jgi:hypothetical protein
MLPFASLLAALYGFLAPASPGVAEPRAYALERARDGEDGLFG